MGFLIGVLVGAGAMIVAEGRWKAISKFLDFLALKFLARLP